MMKQQWDFKEIEKKIIEIGRTWTDDLQHYLFDTFGEEYANRSLCTL